MRLEILKKLREIVSPDSTFLTEPKLKPNPRPRGHWKVNVSTQRNPCAFELAESRHGSASTQSHSHKSTQDSGNGPKLRATKEKVYDFVVL